MTTRWSRRSLLKTGCAAGLGWLMPPLNLSAAGAGGPRRFHLCLAPDAFDRDPQLLATIRDAGVNAVWLAGFCYGHWPWPLEKLQATRAKLESAGLLAHVINLPLGHPGNALETTSSGFPLTPPQHWKLATLIDGKTGVGTSLHDPATAENVAAVRELRQAKFTRFFLDDDFRLARHPGQIGGCFCAEHREQFLRRGGYAAGRWDELLDDVRQRRFTPLLRDWVGFTCDGLTASFRAQERVAGAGRLGIMVMVLGSEKAGIRLTDYRDALFRVGEGAFNDASFNPIGCKTKELFSVLMHRRFAQPDLAFSETTAFPSNKLSARNMAAKLVISTLADVRQTMFMSGLDPFPRSHWETLAPAMKTQAALHARLAGHKPRGPFKHFWGERSRWVGDDNPFSLFLAAGVPFEVTDTPARDGWTFLSNFDAQAVVGKQLVSRGTKFVHRPSVKPPLADGEPVAESLEAVFAFKRRIVEKLRDVPHVLEDEPAVCAWYPSARSVLVWNLEDKPKTLTVRRGSRRQELALSGLEAQLTGDLG
ncbi:MAG: hypothetical protein WCV00_00690 [Verrucomicrobiia bacterium]